MKISIVIPNYNGERYIKKCIDSINKQSVQDFEIVVVDNASTDESCMLIKEMYSNIKLIQLDRNYGFSKAVNDGVKAASGDFVVLLNNDTEVTEGWLFNLLNCIESDDKIFSCSSKMIRYHEKDKIDDAGDQYTILGWAYKRGDGASMKKYRNSAEIFSSCAGAAIYRKDILDKIGGFDDSFFAYMEDIDISYRSKIHGYKNIYCSDAIVYHIGSATSGSRHNEFKVRLAARNNIYLILKNMPMLQLVANLPFILLGCFIKYLFFLRKGLGTVYLEGVMEATRRICKIKKIPYSRKHLINYVKIEFELIINTFKMIYYKIYDK